MSQPSSLRLFATVIWAGFHVFQFGYHITGLNGISGAFVCGGMQDEELVEGSKPLLSTCIEMTPYQFGIVTSFFLLGGLAGSLLIGNFIERWGRRAGCRAASIVVILGCLMLSFSQTFVQAMSARFVIGVGCGFSSVTVPLFLSEISPPKIKNRLGITTQGFIALGVFTTQATALPFAYPFLWRFSPMVSAGLAISLLFGSLMIHESPVWLARKKGVVMRKVLDEEATETTALIARDNVRSPVKSLTIWQLLTTKDKDLRKALLLVVIAMIAQQLCGISPVMYFSTKIMGTVFTVDAKIIALIIASFKIPASFIPAFLMKRYNPRTLMVKSSNMMAISAVVLATSINYGWAIPSAVGIICFVIGFSVGLGPVSWVVLGDVVPENAASAAGSIGIGINWTTNFVMGLAFLPMRDILSDLPFGGVGNIFYALAVICFAISATISSLYP